jgi:hypothetical protein
VCYGCTKELKQRKEIIDVVVIEKPSKCNYEFVGNIGLTAEEITLGRKFT